jgi:hypothetical protein
MAVTYHSFAMVNAQSAAEVLTMHYDAKIGMLGCIETRQLTDHFKRRRNKSATSVEKSSHDRLGGQYFDDINVKWRSEKAIIVLRLLETTWRYITCELSAVKRRSLLAPEFCLLIHVIFRILRCIFGFNCCRIKYIFIILELDDGCERLRVGRHK